jgi:DNA-directed RNA polymerase specialized sigma24 family protein
MKPPDPVVERLDRIAKLLVLYMTTDKSQRDRIELLAAIGFKASEIAEFLNTTPNTVHVALHGIRSDRASRGKSVLRQKGARGGRSR